MVLRDFCQKIKTSQRRWPGYCGIAHYYKFIPKLKAELMLLIVKIVNVKICILYYIGCLKNWDGILTEMASFKNPSEIEKVGVVRKILHKQ